MSLSSQEDFFTKTLYNSEETRILKTRGVVYFPTVSNFIFGDHKDYLSLFDFTNFAMTNVGIKTCICAS